MKAGWEVKTLGDVCEFRGGGTPSKQNADFWGGDIPWVSPKDMKFDVVTDSIDRVTEEAVENSAAKHIPEGAILVVVRSGILARTIPTAIAGRGLTINQDIKAILPNKSLDQKFTAYFFRSAEQYLLDQVKRGATVHKLDMPVLKSLPIPLPPLAEQKRIVSILDEAFEGLDRARENAEANLKSARELFESALQSSFDPTGKIDWEVKTLGESCQVFTDGNWIETKDQSAEGIRLVQTGNVGLGVFKDRRDKARFINEDTFRDLKCFEVLPGDCLISRLPDPVGRACEIPETNDRMITAVDCSIVRTDPQKMDRNYFIYFSQSRAYLNEVDSLCSGTTRRRISRKNLGKISIPLPPLEEQKRIAFRLDKASRQHNSLKEKYTSKLQDISDLRQSLLQKAFAGELT